jgi:hypothetical protein
VRPGLVALLAALCLALGAGPAQAAVPAKSREARRLFDAALQRYQAERDMDAATAAFSEAANLDASFAPPRYNLAVLALRQERWADAQRWFKEYLALEPASPRAEQVQAELARLELLLLAQKSPVGYRALRYDALLQRTQHQLERGDLEAMARLAREAETVDAERWEVPALTGAALARAGRFAEACPLLTTAQARAKGERAVALGQASQACVQELRYRELVDAGQRAYAQGDMSQAGARLYEASQLFPARTEGVLEGAQALSELGDWTRARQLLEGMASSARPEEAAEARRLLAQVEHLRQLAEAAESPRLDMPPGPQFQENLDEALAQMNAELAQAQREAAELERKAEEREARLRERIEELEFELQSSEEEAERAEASAADFDRQAADYASGVYGPGGAVSAAIGKIAASKYRDTAREARERAKQLRKKLQEAQAELPE